MARRPASQPELPAMHDPEAALASDEPTQRRPPSTPQMPAVRPRSEPPPSPRGARVGPTTTPQEAALYDSAVVPRWSSLFGRTIVARIPQGARLTVLDVGCGTGHPAFEVMRRLGEGGRVIAIDRDPALVDLARRRALDDAGKRIFFKIEPVEHLSFGDEVFDIAVGNLVMSSVDDEGASLSEIRRVLAPGGRALLTRPLAGTFEEVLDMFREIAVRRDHAALARRIEQLALRHPSASAWRAQLTGAGLDDVQIHVEEVRLPFRNAREIFSDPMVRLVAMPEWRWLCGMQPGDEAMLEQVEKALDTYFAGGPISLTVHVGLADARKPG
ncbi:class I SAM-dependent methyltransferase [Sandaracinus amylolyticus]|uniref:class I SAM-dependent methyltransferase n=1 Tax=Sandaracinus amylolyticus TaxID=927083 RepID=UPI001F46F828|nr:methyltransferase domain-containing protein [Sandaracinus amylolyticus]